jgi:general secretion pathway protein M
MIENLSPVLRRALALSILGSLLFGPYAMLVRPMLDAYAHDQQTIETLRIAVSRFQQAAHEIPSLKARLEGLRSAGLEQAGYLDGQDETLIAATLQERLKTLVLGEGGQFKSVQILPAKDVEKARRLTLRGQIVLDLSALQRVIYEIEASTPFLFLDNIDIRAISATQKSGQADGAALLDVHFDLYGFMRSAA